MLLCVRLQNGDHVRRFLHMEPLSVQCPNTKPNTKNCVRCFSKRLNFCVCWLCTCEEALRHSKLWNPKKHTVWEETGGLRTAKSRRRIESGSLKRIPRRLKECLFLTSTQALDKASPPVRLHITRRSLYLLRYGLWAPEETAFNLQRSSVRRARL